MGHHQLSPDKWQAKKKKNLENLNCGSANAVEYEEDVVERDGAYEVKEEPGAHVIPGDQFRIENHLFTVVRLHDPCTLHIIINKTLATGQSNPELTEYGSRSLNGQNAP